MEKTRKVDFRKGKGRFICGRRFAAEIISYNGFVSVNTLKTDDTHSSLQNFCFDKYYLYMSRAMKKCVLCHMRTTKAQITLRMRAV